MELFERKTGRTQETQFPLRLTGEEREAVRERARAEDRSMVSLVRRAIKQYLRAAKRMNKP